MRLDLTLFAEDPDIVTPVGMAIDANDRLFAIESHTHLPPSDYDGPERGQCDRSWIFASGVNEANAPLTSV